MVSHPENGSDSPIGSDRDRGRDIIFGIRILLHIHVFVCASMCEFRGRNFVKGGRM